MNEKEKEEFLEEFARSEGTLVGFCVMGGIFSEGIDLMGEKLIGAIIVGTGLPQIGIQREILRQYYDRKGTDGFDYAYRYPGMNKVLQSAGRVIRTQEDIGAILLLDERFRDREYSRLFPAEWSDRRNCTLRTVESELKQFWERSGRPGWKIKKIVAVPAKNRYTFLHQKKGGFHETQKNASGASGDVDFGWNIVCQCPGSTAEHVFSNRTGTDPANRRRQRKIYDEK